MLSFSRVLQVSHLAACVLLFSPSSAQSTPPQAASGSGVPRFPGEPFKATADELRAASSVVPVNSEYDVEMLLDETIYRYADDGTKFYQHRLIYRLDSDEGVKGWAEASLQWDPWYEKPAEIRARVLKTDGRFVELDPKTLTDDPVKGGDTDMYTQSRKRRGPLPGLAVGAIVEEVDSVEDKSPFFAAGAIHALALSSTAPNLDERLIVDLPAKFPYHDRVILAPALSVSRSEADGRRRVVYELMNAPAEHNSDIGLSTNEAGVPEVRFATGASWQDIARSYAALTERQIVPGETTSILPAVSSSDRRVVIAAVVAKLHHEVRYTGVEFGEAQLIPQRPSEVLKRHYGDCKDKAALLVAMLRAKNISANLALLDTGPGIDVDASLPGMGFFDHAIVYVPPSGNDPALWIDATAEFFKLGSLPYMDEGREALIVSPETTGLIRTPDACPEGSQLVETRNFTLPQQGPAHVVETSDTIGERDADYRESYGGADTGAVRKKMEEYVQSAYAAKTLVSITHGPANDLSAPFQLTLVMDKAQRGNTGLDEAVVFIRPDTVLDSLPRWFKIKAEALTSDTPAEIKHQLEIEKANRVATYLFEPFLDERHVRIAIPNGFALRSLPPDKTTQLGPATLKETYSSSESGFVNAVFQLNTGSGHVTAEEALAIRAAALELMKREYVGVYFDQTGAKAIAQGHIREAFEADRRVISASPKEALPHVRLSRALLAAGIGDEAHTEARRATELEPKLAVAWSSLGWALEHNSLGVRFGKDYDLEGAIKAYKQAIALDPDDDDTRFDLAVLYEFNTMGTRYAKDAHMADAVAAYRDLIERNKEKNPDALPQYRENLLSALVMTQQFGEADKVLTSLPTSADHAAFAVVSATALHGVGAGIAQADQANLGSRVRSKTLIAAGATLAQLRMYDEAAQILQAGVSGGDDAPTVARQIEFYKGLKPATIAPLPPTDPARPLQQMTFAAMAGTLTRNDVVADLAHHAYTSEASLELAVQRNLKAQGYLRIAAETSKVSETILQDLIMGNMKFTASGGDATGYSIVMTSLGAAPVHFYVVREDGAYRVVADAGDSVEVGNEALYLLDHGNAPGAKALLDWKREQTHKTGQDDAFAGPLLPRFWTSGSTKADADSPQAMRLAAICLLAGSLDAKPYLSEIASDRDKATGTSQTDLDLLLATAATGAEQPALAIPAALRLLDQEPDSLTALRLAGRAYALQGNTAGWLGMLTSKLQKKPNDHDLLAEQAHAYEVAHNFPAAREVWQKVIDSEKVTASDYNAYAWLGLMDHHLGEAELKAAQQSNILSKNSSFGDLHTLACVYAEEGKVAEARQTLTSVIHASGQLSPNSEVWFGLGLLDEQYGETEAALSAYRKVEAHENDNHTFLEPGSTYVLAQDRIKALSGGK